jgi:hypothetical protein
VIVRGERQAEAAGAGHPATVEPAPTARLDPKPSSG